MPGGEIAGEEKSNNVRRWTSRGFVPVLCSPPVSRLRRFVTLVDRDRASKRKRNILDKEDSPQSVSKRACNRPRCSSWTVHLDSASADLGAGDSSGVGLQPEAGAHEFAGNQDVPDQETQIGAAHCSLAGVEVGNCRIAAIGCPVPAQNTAGSASLKRACAVATQVPALNDNEGGKRKEVTSVSVSLCRRQYSGKSICEGRGQSSSLRGHQSLEDQGAVPYLLDAKAICAGARLHSKGFTDRGQTYAWPSCRSGGHLEDQGQLLTPNPDQRELPALEVQLASSLPGRSANGAEPSHVQELGKSWKLTGRTVVSGRRFNRASVFYPAVSVEGIVGTDPCLGDRTGGMEGSRLPLGRDGSGALPEHERRECGRGTNMHPTIIGDGHGVEGETHKGGARQRHRKLKKLAHVRNDSRVVIGLSSSNSSDSDSSSSALARSLSGQRRVCNPRKQSEIALQGGFPAGQRNVGGEPGTCAPQSRVYYPQNVPFGSEGLISKASNHHTCDQTRASAGASVPQSNPPMHLSSSENTLLARTVPNGAAMQSKVKAARSQSVMATPPSSHELVVVDRAVDFTDGGFSEGGGSGGGVRHLQKWPDHYSPDHYSLKSTTSDDSYSSPSCTSSPSHDEADPSTAISRPHPVPADVSWLSSVSESSEESEDGHRVSVFSDDESIQTPASSVLTLSSSSSYSRCDTSSYDTSSDSGTSSASPSSLSEEFRRKRREAALLGKSLGYLGLQSHPIRMLLGGRGDDSQQTSQDSLPSPLKARADHDQPVLLLEDGRCQPSVASRSAQQEKHSEGTRTTQQDTASASISGALRNLSLGSERAESAVASHHTWLSQSAQWGIPLSLRQLTSAEQARLLAVWSRGNDRESVSKFKGEDITRKDLATLQGESWINDEVVNFYLAIVQSRNREWMQALAMGSRRTEDRVIPRVHIYSSFFFTRLACSPKGYDYTGVRRWTRTINIFDFDILIVPVNKQESHWTLLAVNIKEKALEYYDSFLCSRSDFCYRVFDAMCRYLEDERLDKKHPNTDVDPSRPWRKRLMTEGIPQQEDAGSCGVFMCTFAELLARGYRPPFNFSQCHIPVIRQGIAADILFPGKAPDTNLVPRSAPCLPNQNGSSKVPAGAVVCLLDDDD